MIQTMTATSLASVIDRISRRNRMSLYSLASGSLVNSFSVIRKDAQIDPALAQDGQRFTD
jgi:hypothetical protein